MQLLFFIDYAGLTEKLENKNQLVLKTFQTFFNHFNTKYTNGIQPTKVWDAARN